MMPMMSRALSQDILESWQPLGHRMYPSPPLAPWSTSMTTCVGRCSWLIYTLNLRHNFIYKLLLGTRTQRAARPKLSAVLVSGLLVRLRFAAFRLMRQRRKFIVARGLAPEFIGVLLRSVPNSLLEWLQPEGATPR